MDTSKQYNFNVEMLLQYGTDMTLLAEMGKLDPVIGREREIEHMIEVLLKRQKGNPCLIGDAGVGKTAIIEGLAIKIAQDSVPPKLKGKKVFSIEVALLDSDSNSSFVERVREVINEVLLSKGSVILFIDEVYSLVTNKHGYDAGSILKRALARDDFKCIGATTLAEYTRFVDSDAAFKRRFESIHVSEPSREDAINMLNAIIDKYQTHHAVKYTTAALVAAVDLSNHCIRESLLPDKAIDLIDRAGARAQMLGKTNVTEAEIEDVVSACTRVPVTQLSPKESNHILGLEDNMKRSLIGQDEAIEAVSACIRRARVGIRDETKPIGCFLFTGPTGVGKTEMAKVLATEYFGSKEAMVRLDMSEYMEYHTVSRMIGSPPGYRNSDQGGQLTEQVRRRPHSLVLFDEVEKAHEQVLNVLLQICDDGRLTDGKGMTVDFSNTIVILTSNVGSSSNSKQLRDVFKPELLNRFDQVVEFKALEVGHVERILQIVIDEFRAKVADKKKIEVAFSTGLKKWLILVGYDERYGARALKRAFAAFVETKLADEILYGRVTPGQSIIIDVTTTGKETTHTRVRARERIISGCS